MKSFRIFYILFCLATLLAACGKEGPQGPIGPPGPGSATGQTFTVSNWTYTDPSWTGAITYAVITQAIVNSGGVFVYWKNPAGNWVALPLSYYPTDWYTSTLQAEHFVGGVKVLKTDSDLSQPLPPGDQMFKVIAISSQGLARNPDLDWTNYAEVSGRFDGLESE